MSVDRRLLMILAATGIAGLAAMPFLFRGEDAEHQLLRRQIAAMTAAERTHLERNFDAFQRLSEPERDRFRELQVRLETDARDHHGRTQDAMNIYAGWLASIPPFQRVALQKETDPHSRLKLVQEILDQQQQARLELPLDEHRRQRLGAIPTLSPADLERVLAILADVGSGMLTAADQQQLDGYEGLQRSLKVCELLGLRERRLMPLLSEARLKILRDAIEDRRARHMLEVAADDQPATVAVQKAKMSRTVWKNVELALDREVRQRAVTDQKLKEVFDQCSAAEQDELLELPPSLFRLELRRKFQASQSSRPLDRQNMLKFLRSSTGERAPRNAGQGGASAGRTGAGERNTGNPARNR